jgi:hypothetical protein
LRRNHERGGAPVAGDGDRLALHRVEQALKQGLSIETYPQP